MTDYSIQLGVLRHWNRVAIAALLLALPTAYLVALATEGTFWADILPVVAFICFVAAFGLAYIRIRQFRCPRCGKHFNVTHAFAANNNGRACVHCSLPAYASRIAK
jgi:hypothetical protein